MVTKTKECRGSFSLTRTYRTEEGVSYDRDLFVSIPPVSVSVPFLIFRYGRTSADSVEGGDVFDSVLL